MTTARAALSRTSHAGLTAGDVYPRLLAQFPLARQGYGREPTFPGRAPQPMTYALIALAELRRDPLGGRPVSDRAIRALRWLARNADLDADNEPGWGLPHAWDAFSDGRGAAGSINPPHHPYTITTALAIEALAAAYGRGWPPERRRRRGLVDLITRCARRWCGGAFETRGDGGFFWYSPHEADAKFCPNVSAMMTGALQQALAAELVEDDDGRVRAVVDAAARGVVAARHAETDDLSWHYIVGVPHPRLNDAVHHAYVVWGMENYRDGGGAVTLPWGPAKAFGSVEAYRDADRLLEFPMGTRRGGKGPMRLWGAGMSLAVIARGGRLSAAQRFQAIVLDRYLTPHGPTVYPGARPPIFHARHAAHLLLGLAERLRRPGAGSDARCR